VENIRTAKILSDTPQKDASLLKRLLKKFPKKESVKNAKINLIDSLSIVRIESIHPGDAYFKKGHNNMTGIWKKERNMISSPVGWESGYFIPIDILINPGVSVMFFIGIKIKKIKSLTKKELLLWNKILNENKP
jgi:predicted AlkP superfamily pyrophosphatase or phosphodiesterase